MAEGAGLPPALPPAHPPSPPGPGAALPASGACADLGDGAATSLGGPCPLAVAFIPRRENSIFSLMSRKHSSDVMLPCTPGEWRDAALHAW